jgi:hypothetical protein
VYSVRDVLGGSEDAEGRPSLEGADIADDAALLPRSLRGSHGEACCAVVGAADRQWMDGRCESWTGSCCPVVRL